jgi:hypothetical protein
MSSNKITYGPEITFLSTGLEPASVQLNQSLAVAAGLVHITDFGL